MITSSTQLWDSRATIQFSPPNSPFQPIKCATMLDKVIIIESLGIRRSRFTEVNRRFPSNPLRKPAWLVNTQRDGWSPSVHSRTGQQAELQVYKGLPDATATYVLAEANLTTIFRQLDDHVVETAANDNYILWLVKVIAKSYCKEAEQNHLLLEALLSFHLLKAGDRGRYSRRLQRKTRLWI
ncbi:uncharacterized protein [Acropora muricata]|uniref:uncharacterized protein n=1 Tax=Acropora muricata TaxID=159855 RepID=UPI0034E5AA5E